MEGDRFGYDIAALLFTYFFLRIACYFILKWKIAMSR